MRYKHFSFDLWGTLIKSNPIFKYQRAFYIAENFNKSNSTTVEDVRTIIGEVDVMCNYTNEVYGGSIRAEEMYAMILLRLGHSVNEAKRAIPIIMKETKKLFLAHPPSIAADVFFVLPTLTSKGASISVLSNTGFIGGRTIREFIDSTPLKGLFNFQLYSDEIGASKPSQIAYNCVLDQVYRKYVDNFNEVIHIGDSVTADIEGARNAGIDSFQINTNDKTIKDVLSL